MIKKLKANKSIGAGLITCSNFYYIFLVNSSSLNFCLGGKYIYYPESSRERIEFAAHVMDCEPSEWGLFLNASGTDYVNFPDEEFEIIEIEGKTALFTNNKMTDADVPKGLHCYHLRHGDDGNFFTLEKSAAVNHAGSVIVREPMELGENGCISLNNQNAPNFTGETTLMEDFFTNEEEQSEIMGMGVT